MKKGKFIVIDGGEGAGKSTQVKKIKKHFGDRVLITREPGGSPYAEEIRSIILNSPHAKQADAKTHFALFWAGRADHIKNTILPALEKGIHVICDRFDSSTYAYQIYGQEHVELEDIFFTVRSFYLGKCVPDLYIFMNVDIEEGLKRKRQNQAEDMNHFDDREVAFHGRMRKGFEKFYTKVPHKLLDANKSFEEVTKDLITMIDHTI